MNTRDDDDLELSGDGTPREKLVELADYWKKQIEKEQKAHKGFRDDADAAWEAYSKKCKYNIAWPTVEITTSSLYSSTPAPEVMRRQRDGDKVQKLGAQVLERAIDYCLDVGDFDTDLRKSVRHFVGGGFGQARVVYKPTFGTVTGMDGQPQKAIASQEVDIEHYNWSDFGWQPCKSWEHCEWVYFVHHKSKREVLKEFKVEAEPDDDDEEGLSQKVKVYEIIHKTTKSVICICDQFDEPLEVRSDDLGLSGFPCPRPMMTNEKSKVMEPVPDFNFYQEQFEELDRVAMRQSRVTKAIKAVATYDSHFSELANLENKQDGAYVPVQDLMGRLENSRLDSVIADLPLELYLKVADSLRNRKEELKDEVYEILGIADIMRGETNAQEGVETQQLKSEFGAVRLRQKQGAVDSFCRDLFRIMAEIIAEHFQPHVLQKMTGIQVTPEVVALLRNDAMRSMSIDIETDSTNAIEKLRRRKERVEGLETLLGYLGNILPAVKNGFMQPEMARELLLIAVRSMSIGSTGNLEDIISNFGGPLEQMVGKLQQQLGEARGQMEQMQKELKKRTGAQAAEDAASARLKDAQAQKTLEEIPLVRAETGSQQVEMAANASGFTQHIRPLE